MTAPGGNFEHLVDFDPALARFGAHAERYFLDDANTALIKVRQFAERLAIVVAARSGVDVEPRSAFADVLRALQLDGSAPREVLELLHRIRKLGNTAVHDAGGERRVNRAGIPGGPNV
jgi:type I restriction enzyme R subunit